MLCTVENCVQVERVLFLVYTLELPKPSTSPKETGGERVLMGM